MKKKIYSALLNLIIVFGVLVGALTYLLFSNLSQAVIEYSEDSLAEASGTSVQFPEQDLNIRAVGDIMLARKIERLMSAHGREYPFVHVKEFLSSADITFGNLECAVSDRGKKLPGKGIWFRAKPIVTDQLVNSGFDVMSIANNHSLDYRAEALMDTRESLLEAGIAPVGGGRDISSAREPRVVTVDGISIGFLAYSEMADMIWSYDYPRKLKAEESLAGIAPFVPENIVADIRSLASGVDYTIVSLHWGTEYASAPSEKQRELAHSFIDAGADVIIGHHPHVFQGVEVYNQGLIAYSLGNFIFDQPWTDTREGLILETRLNEIGIANASLYPVIIYEGQPRLVQNEWARNAAQDLKAYSGRLGTQTEIIKDPLAVRVYGAGKNYSN